MQEDSLKENVLDFSLDRDSIYFEDNIFSLRYINILNQFNNKNDENLINFIKTNSIKYLVIKNYNQERYR